MLREYGASVLKALTDEQNSLLRSVLTFVELRGKTDGLESGCKAKMREYIENGAQLGWLVIPQKVYVYRPNQAVEVLGSHHGWAGRFCLAFVPSE